MNEQLPQEPVEETPQESSKGKTGLIIAIIVVLLLMVGVAIAGYFFYSQVSVDTTPTTSLQAPVPGSEDVDEMVVDSDELDTSDWKTYRNKELGFEILLPKSWEFSVPSYVHFSISNVNVKTYQEFRIEVTPNQSLDDYIRHYDSTALIESDKRTTAITEQKDIMMNGIKFTKLVGTTPYGLETIIYFTKQNEVAYAIIYLNLPGYKDVPNIISTFKYIESQTLTSPSGKYEASLITIDKKPDAKVTFEVPETDFPTRLIIKNVETGEETIVTESTSPAFGAAWTTLALGKFVGPSDEYFEYFIGSYTSSYVLYDIEKKEASPFRLTGHYAGSGWYDGQYITCSTSGFDPWQSSIIAINLDDLESEYFVYPEKLNAIRLEERREAIYEQDIYKDEEYDGYRKCSLDNNLLLLNDIDGSNLHKINLDTLKIWDCHEGFEYHCHSKEKGVHLH